MNFVPQIRHNKRDMKKTQIFLSRNIAFFVGAGSILDFAGSMKATSRLAERKRFTASRSGTCYENWYKVGDDFRAAMQLMHKSEKG